MGSARRAFTPEYKAQSVAFVVDGGRPVAEAARNVGVHEVAFGKWVTVARDAAESGKNPDAPLGESERAELGGGMQDAVRDGFGLGYGLVAGEGSVRGSGQERGGGQEAAGRAVRWPSCCFLPVRGPPLACLPWVRWRADPLLVSW